MANRTKTTDKKREQFLVELAETANVRAATAKTKIARGTWYDLRARDAEFKTKWDEAVELGTCALEDEAVRRAHRGVDKPVFYQGKRCGTVREYSDTLLIFMLKARRPEKYRDNSSVEISGKGGKSIEFTTPTLTPEERAARVVELLGIAQARRDAGERPAERNP